MNKSAISAAKEPHLTLTLYTAGYGNRTPEQLIQILKEAGVNHVFDVRRKGSKARIRLYDQGAWMSTTLGIKGIAYYEFALLANHAGSLGKYKGWLDCEDGLMAVAGATYWLEHLGHIFSESRHYDGMVPCLLCSELRHIKDGVINCHRVLVAEAIVEKAKESGVDISIVHL